MENTYKRYGVRNKVVKFIQYIFMLFCFIFIAFYKWGGDVNVLYFSILCLLLQNILYGFTNFSKRILFIFFQFTFFLFLMTKPIIAILRKEDWQAVIYSDFALNADIKRMLLCMFISLLSIWVGAVISEKVTSQHSYLVKKSNYTDLIKINMRYITLFIFIISSIFSLAQGFEKILFIKSHTYLEYYTNFKTHMPYIMRLIASFTQYSFCFYLATLPIKRRAFLPCCIYIGLAIPDLIMGSRADICLNILLVFFYYLLRDSWRDTFKWLGKIEKLLILFISPIATVFLGVYVDIRANRAVNLSSIPSAIVNFLNDQGTTFPYMCAGMGNIDKLPKHISYTFGTILDYFKYGSLGRIFAGVKPLGDSNSILRANKGNSYAHHMSYILLQKDYLNGRGIGSSYINEIYTDFGYIGIMFFSLIIGFLLIYLVRFAKHSCWGCAILLLSFSGMIYIPRAEFTSFIDYITKMQFWFIVIVIYFATYLFGRKFIYKHVNFDST